MPKKLTVGRSFKSLTFFMTGLVLINGCGTDGTDPDPTPSIAITVSPSSASVEQGGSTTTTGTVTATDFSGTVSFAVEGAPTGVTATVGTPTVAGNMTSAEITIAVGGAVAPGMYNLTVRASGSGVTAATATFALTVTAAPAYELSLTPAAISVEQGANGTAAVNVTRTNFTDAVDLSLEGAPTGVTHSFDIDPVTGNLSNVTINVDVATVAGVYPLTIRGTTTTLTDRTATLTLTVTEPAPYNLSVNPTALTVVQGMDGQAVVTITRNTFQGDIVLSLGNAPVGVTGTFTPNPAGSADATSDLTVSVGGAVAAGMYNLTIDGTMVVPGANGDDVQAGSALVDQQTALTLVVQEPASYSLSLSSSDLTIVQGATGTTTVTIARTNFTDAVTLALGGPPPANVTGVFDPAAPTGTTSTLTVSVGATVPAGTYNLSVDGTASIGNQTTALNVTVTEPAGFTLSMAPPSLSLLQGASGSSTINISRTGGFSESVAFTVTGQPTGLTATPNPASTTGASASLDIAVGGGVTPGTYPLTITGDATGTTSQTTTLNVTVTMSGGNSVTLDFSSCDVADRPIWVASQDGSGPWSQLVGTNDVYTFNINSATGGVAFTTNGVNTSVAVQYFTQAELIAGPLTLCGTPTTTKTVTGTAAGVPVTGIASLSLGGGVTAFVPNGPFTINNVDTGAQDLVGYALAAFGAPSANDIMLIRRAQDIADQGSLGTVDFGTEGFTPTSAAVTITGLGAETNFASIVTFNTATATSSCQPANLYTTAPANGNLTVFGAPNAQQQTGDFHSVFFTASNAGLTQSRSVTEYFASVAQRAIALGSALQPTTITDLSGNYKRLQATNTLPAEYNSILTFSYTDGTNSAAMIASAAWVAANSPTLTFPDFSNVTGWMDTWLPGPSTTTNWAFTGSGLSGGVCVEGGRIISALDSGTI